MSEEEAGVTERRKRGMRALWLGGLGTASAVASIGIALVLGYDNLAYGTPGATVTTLLFVASSVLLLMATITWTRATTPIGRRTGWRRVGKTTLIVWGATLGLWVLVVLLARVAQLAAAAVAILASLVPVFLLPTLLWLPIWTVLSAIRGQGSRREDNAVPVVGSVEAAAVIGPEVNEIPQAAPVLGADQPETAGSRQRARVGPGILVIGGVLAVVIIALIAAVFFLLGRQSSVAIEVAPESASPTPVASVLPAPASSPPESDPVAGGDLSPGELYGLASAVLGCTGRLGQGVPPEAAPGYISFDSGLIWEPVYHQVAKSLGVPDGSDSVLSDLGLRDFLFRTQAFSAADDADPRSWYELNKLWNDAGEYASKRSEEVALAGEPRGYAFQDVGRKFGSKLTKACLDPVYRAIDLAKADGLSFDAWIAQYRPDLLMPGSTR